MYFHPHVIHLTLCSLVFMSQNYLAYAARPSKENPRAKSKCLGNITTNPKCVTVGHPYCLDIKLPYNSIALLDSFPGLDLDTFENVQHFLDKWRKVQKLPTCWPMLQVALCSLMMPACDEDPVTGRAIQYHQASVDICNDLMNFNKTNCKFLQKELVEEWHSLFNCSDSNLYARNCTNELRNLKQTDGLFRVGNADSKHVCQYPLVPTIDNLSWFKDIEGCALHCKFPITSPAEQASISWVIKLMCFIGLIGSTAALLLDKVNNANRESSRFVRVTKRCNFCQLFIYTGYSLQIILNQEVGCKTDGSILYGQPLVANSCILSFFLTYLPFLSSLFWSAYLGKLCHEKLSGQGKPSSNVSKLDGTLSLFNYGIPLALFVSVAFSGHIDGHGLYGICTVGQQSAAIKTIFVFVPSIVGMIYGNYFFVRIIMKVAFVKTTITKPFQRDLMRISALVTLTMLQTILSIANYIYESRHQRLWLESIESYVACQLNLKDIKLLASPQECTLNSKPFITLYYLEIVSTLLPGLVIASWAFCDSNYRGLKRKLIDILEDDQDRHRSMPLNRAGGSETGISRASLQSVTLSIVGGYIGGNRQHRGANKRGKTSRDVVNDCRQQRITNQQQCTADEELFLKRPDLSPQEMMMMIMIHQSFKPPDVDTLQFEFGKQPNFDHGFAGQS